MWLMKETENSLVYIALTQRADGKQWFSPACLSMLSGRTEDADPIRQWGAFDPAQHVLFIRRTVSLRDVRL
jgi:hypothetical protein